MWFWGNPFRNINTRLSTFSQSSLRSTLDSRRWRKLYGFLYMKMYCPDKSLSRCTHLERRQTIVYPNALQFSASHGNTTTQHPLARQDSRHRDSERMDLPSIITIMRKAQTRCAGHLSCMSDCRIPKQLLYGELSHGSRKVGGRRKGGCLIVRRTITQKAH